MMVIYYGTRRRRGTMEMYQGLRAEVISFKEAGRFFWPADSGVVVVLLPRHVTRSVGRLNLLLAKRA